MTWQTPCIANTEGEGQHCRCWWSGEPCCACGDALQPSGARQVHGPSCGRTYPTTAELLRHLIEAHCPEGWEPECFIAGARAYGLADVHTAARALGYPVVACPEDGCSDRDHVVLLTRELRARLLEGA
jgi:hypothetical protein